MKLPGPDHPITIAPAPTRWQARFNGQVIADSADARVLREARYPAVIYFPRADVVMAALTRTDHSTYCPYKGDAAYFSIGVGDTTSENAVWSYETPYLAMAEIEGRLAFYTDRVEVFEVR